ncbi:MAG TPA: suppressor of fused domain protein [Candidatus Angelobacter sp.]|jgi:hypothetical protein|nr:suppressor of fused domain protein [Candidatus Angelobacter sp.]
MASKNKNYFMSIHEHYIQSWVSEPEAVQFNRGPIHDLPSEFRILRFAPNKIHSMWAYATVCMSQPGDRYPLELHMFAPMPNDDVTELLVVTAHYHRTGKELGLGHSVNFGRPWWSGSQCDRGLISLPYLDGPQLEWLEGNGQKVRFLWLIPVTKAEIDFKKESGLDALEKKFDERKLDYLNPLRSSVV